MVGAFLLGFALIAIRAMDLAVLQGTDLKQRADEQHKKRVEIPASRGLILDRNSRPLAISMPVYTLSFERDRIKSPITLARDLAPLIAMDEKELRERLTKSKPGTFPVLKRRINPEKKKKIEALKDDNALFFFPDEQRFYPLGEVTAHVLGFTGAEGNGLEGLEKKFDDVLTGEAGVRLISHDRLGRPMLEAQVLKPAQPGVNLTLSIDGAIQYIAYRALMKVVTKHQAKGGSVIVMDPRNGELLALVNQPGFNPNNVAGSPPDHHRNRAVVDTYEPGSTFKVFSVGAALDLGVVKADTLVDCGNGGLQVRDRFIRDFHKMGVVPVTEVLQKSSNVGAAKIGMMTGNMPQLAYLKAFHFGSRLGTAFLHETPGRIPDIRHYEEVGLANRSFGQGISVTPLQVTAAMSAAINGGVYYVPRLILEREQRGKRAPESVPAPVRVIKQETSDLLRVTLEGVVGPEGTAPNAKLEGYTAGGKTGTAQKAGPGGYAKGLYYASFVGFTPVEAPRLMIFVGVDEPQGGYYGGLVAGPVFREIAQEVMPLLTRLPSQTTPPPLPQVRPPAAQQAEGDGIPPKANLETVMQQLKKQGITPLVTGHGQLASMDKTPDGRVRLTLQ